LGCQDDSGCRPAPHRLAAGRSGDRRGAVEAECCFGGKRLRIDARGSRTTLCRRASLRDASADRKKVCRGEADDRPL
jgi:hypothetical protein